MDEAQHDVLAYMSFPREHRQKLHSTNPPTAEAWIDGHVHMPSPSSAGFRNRCSTTTTAAWCRAFWRTGRAGGRGSSAGSCRITSCAIVTGAQARGTTRARWRVWWALPGATSWCRCRALPAGKRSIGGSRGVPPPPGDIPRGHRETIGERLVRDLAAMAAPPAAPFEACAPDSRTGRLAVSGPLRDQRLLGAGGLWPSRRLGARLRRPGGDRLRRRGHRPPSPVP